MKNVVILIVFVILVNFTYAQKVDLSYKGTWELFNKNSDSIIEQENTSIDIDFLHTRLRSVSLLPNGGFSLHYTTEIDTSQSSKIYTFNKYKMLTHMTLIQDVGNRDEQIEYFLANGFYRKSPYVYYHKTLDLMVKITFDNKFVAFDYSNKPYIPKK